MKRVSAAILIAALNADASVVFSNNCQVLSEPKTGARSVCTLPKGAPVRKLSKDPSGVYFVETDECQGFVPRSCLMKDTSDVQAPRPVGSAIGLPSSEYVPKPVRANTAATRSERELASVKNPVVYFGPLIGVAALWGKAVSGATSSRGTGFDFGLNITVPLGGMFRASLQPTYAIYGLTRTIDGTGSISDGNPASFTHKIGFFGASLLGGIDLGGGANFSGTTERWWFDLGFSYLVAGSAKQTDNFGGETEFTTKDKLFLLLLGPSGDFSVARGVWASAYIQFFYNVGAQSGSQLLGGRFLLAFNFGV